MTKGLRNFVLGKDREIIKYFSSKHDLGKWWALLLLLISPYENAQCLCLSKIFAVVKFLVRSTNKWNSSFLKPVFINCSIWVHNLMFHNWQTWLAVVTQRLMIYLCPDILISWTDCLTLLILVQMLNVDIHY